MIIDVNTSGVNKNWMVILFNNAFTPGNEVLIEDDFGGFVRDNLVGPAGTTSTYSQPGVYTRNLGRVDIRKIYPVSEYENLTKGTNKKSENEGSKP